MEHKLNLLEVLPHIDPAMLSYQEWVNVGMGLKEEGYTAADWDDWSRRDPARYRSGECFKKWTSFYGTGTPVTGGTIVQMAKDQGWRSSYEPDREIGWDDAITVDSDDLVVVDKNWIEGKEIKEPKNWDPKAELIKYLEILFDSTENVGYVTTTWEKEGKYLPTKGAWDRTAGELIEEISSSDKDLTYIVGDYKEEAGAWIRFNPLDGKGCKNDNVTDFRYALVESDQMELEEQNALIRELELPVACLVYSGGKSLHAIVRVEAADYQEYRKRVDYLYDVCQKNGLKLDSQNRNPSRLSRMPGITRNGKKQFLVDTNIGKESWAQWQEWIEGINDDLPDPESLEGVWDDLPALAPELISGVLRQGHKMLLAGPSKAGKSFMQIEMTIGIAEGTDWLGWKCAQGKVLYVNLELDRASCLHRFKDVYQSMGLQPNNLKNIDIWNLRGKSVPMDKLAPKLIRRAAKKDYIAVIIDPIYKVITGDENSADQMANFCNQFDKVCTELGAAVIYCHHHSKGSQGGKRSMDRASGSGVFARDPDALLDLIELELNDDIMKQEENKAICRVCTEFLKEHYPTWDDDLSMDDVLNHKTMLDYSRDKLQKAEFATLNHLVEEAVKKVRNKTAWRVEGTLREFPKFTPVNVWFDYPKHEIDEVGVLKDIQAESELPPYQRATKARKKSAKEQKEEKRVAFEEAMNTCNFGEPPTVEMLCETLGLAKRTIESRMKEFDYEVIKGSVYKKGYFEKLQKSDEDGEPHES